MTNTSELFGRTPAHCLRTLIKTLSSSLIDGVLFLDAAAVRESIRRLEEFSDENTDLTNIQCSAVEKEIACGFAGHARVHVDGLLHSYKGSLTPEVISARRSLETFERSPTISTLPDLLKEVEELNKSAATEMDRMIAVISAAASDQPHVCGTLIRFVGRWLSGGMPRNRPAGSAAIVGPPGSGRSRLLHRFVKALQHLGLTDGAAHDEIDMRRFADPSDGGPRLIEQLELAAAHAGRRVYVFDNAEDASPIVRDLLSMLTKSGAANCDARSVTLANPFLFFLFESDPDKTFGNAFTASVQETITIPAPSPKMIEEMIRVEVSDFVHDFAVHAGIHLTVSPTVSRALLPAVIERGGYGRAVPVVIEEHLRLPIADMTTRGVVTGTHAVIDLDGPTIVLAQADRRLPLDTPRNRSPALLDLEAELSKIIGLDSVKEMLRTLRAQIVADQRRREYGLVLNTVQSRHMLFLGNPGTGKTTVARLVARMLRDLGVLREGHLVEVGRSSLVAGYVGQTAEKTLAAIRSARGGVLFIDEAYSLTRGADPFGMEAIDTIVGEIETQRDDLVVIMAGYTQEMEQLLQSNPGLPSRFGFRFNFPDYSAVELSRIAIKDAKSRGFSVGNDVERGLIDLFGRNALAGKVDQGNGRLARTHVETAIARQATRVANHLGADREDLQTLTSEDFGIGPTDSVKLEDAGRQALALLDDIIGLESIKAFVRQLASDIHVTQMRKSLGMSVSGPRVMHMVFKGNPGTGKTTIARLLGRLLRDVQVLKAGHIVEVDRSALVAGYLGQTALKTREKVREALGGILFVDEAYSLTGVATDPYGREALDTMVKCMEDHRDSLVVIFAGYSAEMESLLDVNPGLRSRFPHVIEFADYSHDELIRIADRMLYNQGFTVTTDARRRLGGELAKAVGDRTAGNGRYVRNVLEKAILRHASRVALCDSPSREMLATLEESDIPIQ